MRHLYGVFVPKKLRMDIRVCERNLYYPRLFMYSCIEYSLHFQDPCQENGMPYKTKNDLINHIVFDLFACN